MKISELKARIEKLEQYCKDNDCDSDINFFIDGYLVQTKQIYFTSVDKIAIIELRTDDKDGE